VKKQDTKQKLFEMMGKMDNSFKPKLNEGYLANIIGVDWEDLLRLTRFIIKKKDTELLPLVGKIIRNLDDNIKRGMLCHLSHEEQNIINQYSN